jgi:CheY-like chemotaxis protein
VRDKKAIAKKDEAARKILVVDDNKAAADALASLLSHYGHQINKAYSGAEALEKRQAFDPQVILLDIGMPDMDGYEVAKNLRGSGWNGTLIAITGYGQDADRALTASAGFDHHLVKPVAVRDVMSRI